MNILTNLVEYVLHLQEHLAALTAQYGAWVYALLFAIIFFETGVVIMPFLPGDSLLFAAGTLASLGSLNIWVLFAVCASAAILGDSVNYWIGSRVGPPAFERDIRFLKREYLERTQRFYDKHGGKAIFLARFVPIVRTFAPFVAGVGTMSYGRFITYNVLGGVTWVGLFLFAGYFFGRIPAVADHFGLVIAAIVVISIVPIIYELWQARREERPAPAAP